jgi:hypothetical protein
MSANTEQPAATEKAVSKYEPKMKVESIEEIKADEKT